MSDLTSPEFAKLDDPLSRWYDDPERRPEDLVSILVRPREERDSAVDQLIRDHGLLPQSAGVLIRAFRIRTDRDFVRRLARHPDVAQLEMVHRSSSWRISPYLEPGDGTDG